MTITQSDAELSLTIIEAVAPEFGDEWNDPIFEGLVRVAAPRLRQVVEAGWAPAAQALMDIIETREPTFSRWYIHQILLAQSGVPDRTLADTLPFTRLAELVTTMFHIRCLHNVGGDPESYPDSFYLEGWQTAAQLVVQVYAETTA